MNSSLHLQIEERKDAVEAFLFGKYCQEYSPWFCITISPVMGLTNVIVCVQVTVRWVKVFCIRCVHVLCFEAAINRSDTWVAWSKSHYWTVIICGVIVCVHDVCNLLIENCIELSGMSGGDIITHVNINVKTTLSLMGFETNRQVLVVWRYHSGPFYLQQQNDLISHLLALTTGCKMNRTTMFSCGRLKTWCCTISYLLQTHMRSFCHMRRSYNV